MELNIYRIDLKEDEEVSKSMLATLINVTAEDIESNGLLKVSDMCYRQYFVKIHQWDKFETIEKMLKKYKDNEIEFESDDYKVHTPSAIVFIKVDKYWYALTYGHGRFLLDLSRVKKGWGISIIINLYNNNHGLISTVRSHQLDMFKRHETLDIQSGTTLESFGIESYRAIIDGIKLKLQSDEFHFRGQVSGADNIQISTNSEDLVSIIEQLETNYHEELNIDIYNNIISIKEQTALEAQNKWINSNRVDFCEKFTVNLPHKALSYDWYTPNAISIRKKRMRNNIKDEATFKDISDEIKKILNYVLDTTNEEINLPISDELSQYVVRITDPNSNKYQDFSFYECITYSYTNNSENFVLDEGQIYQFKDNLLERINKDFNDIISKSVTTKLHKIKKGQLEDSYNDSFLKLGNNYYVLDKQMVGLSGKSSFEIADVIIRTEKGYTLIHNKGTGKNSISSTSISHLARQIEGSLLFLTGNLEKKYHDNIKQKLTNQGIDAEDFFSKVSSKDITLVAGIVTTNNDLKAIPDFSKATFIELSKKINGNRYKFEIVNIDVE